jgi:hypothetical protein
MLRQSTTTLPPTRLPRCTKAPTAKRSQPQRFPPHPLVSFPEHSTHFPLSTYRPPETVRVDRIRSSPSRRARNSADHDTIIGGQHEDKELPRVRNTEANKDHLVGTSTLSEIRGAQVPLDLTPIVGFNQEEDNGHR